VIATKKNPHRARRSRRRIAAKRGVRSKWHSGNARPHLNFLQQFQGSLSEIIVEGDLETLNLGLGFLFARLREAREQYDQAGDGERVAAFTAVVAMWQFIVLFSSPLAEGLHVPLLNLQVALTALDQNNVMPILKPVARSGRAVSSHAYAALKGHAAASVMRLRKLDLDPKQACELVAKELARLGVRPERGSGSISTNTVRHWCDDVASDVGTAAMMYAMTFTDEENARFDALKPAEALSFALASLRRYVQQMFPTPRTTRKNPVNPSI
jgi:hypothetical protein